MTRPSEKPKKRIPCYVDQEMADWLDEKATGNSTSRNWHVNRALEAYRESFREKS